MDQTIFVISAILAAISVGGIGITLLLVAAGKLKG